MYGEAKMPVTTHLSNLFQVGHWCKPGGGLHNVMLNAYTSYHIIKDAGFCS
jgi:phytoene dehydrogenase-like protein